MIERTLFALVLILVWPRVALAEDLRVDEVVGDSSTVNDALFTPNALFTATNGGVLKFERVTGKLLHTYTTKEGLDSLAVKSLEREGKKGAIVATTAARRCVLKGQGWTCGPLDDALLERQRSVSLSLDRLGDRRITVKKRSSGQSVIGTAGGGAFLNHTPLVTGPTLKDAHVTSLALFRGDLWVGTFNGGLMKRTQSGAFEALGPSESGSMINALAATSTSLFVGTSQGLFQSQDGRTFERVDFVEGAVVGLAFDQVSLWAATTGALYRVRDEGGPRSDVWWMPGGSRSLQKLSAEPGAVWIATEDRGAVLMRHSARTVSEDRPFSVFDRSRGLASSWSLSTAALSGGGALMSTLREGLTHIKSDGSFEQVPTEISPWGLATMAEGDEVWIGSQGGAERISLSTKQRWRILGLPDQRVHAFLRDNRPSQEQYVWIGTEGGLAKVKAPQAADRKKHP